jgi:hypothetical protein
MLAALDLPLKASALPRLLAYAVGVFAIAATGLALVHFAS